MAPPAAPAFPSQRLLLLRSAWRVLLAGALALLLAAAALLWAGAGTETGSAWLLRRVPGLDVQGLQGALLGGNLQAERLHWASADGRLRIRVEQPRIEGLGWRLWPEAGVWAALQAARVAASKVEIDSAQGDSAPPTLPPTLGSPLWLELARIELGELRIDKLPPLHDLQAALNVAAAQHEVEGLRARFDTVQIEGRGRIATAAPFAIDARLAASAAADADAGRPAWAAELQAGGMLDAIAASATLRVEPRPGLAAGTLDAQVTLHPLRPWPVGPLKLSTEALDLAALHPAAPRTHLSGQAQIDSGGLDRPATGRIDLTNAAAGTWQDQRLPLRRALLTLRARPDRPEEIDIEQAELVFGDAAASAGRLLGSGSWRSGTLAMQARAEQLRPALLDRRAPAMTLGGPLQFSLAGLPSAATQAAAASAAGLTAEFSGTLEGRLDAAPQAASLDFAGRASARQFTLERAEARSGAARAQLQLALQRSGPGPWQLRSEGLLESFDPSRWLPGDEASAWRRSPHLLNGRWKVDLRLPARGTPSLQWLAALQGDGRFELADSRLAGIAASGHLELAQGGPTGAAEPARLVGELLLGGNRMRLQGRGDPRGNGAGDRLQIDLDAPALAALAPLAALHPDSARWAPRAGRASGRVELRGRWPDLHTSGQAELQGLAAGGLAVAQAQARWQLDSGATQGVSARHDTPLVLDLALRDASLGGARLARAKVAVGGSLAAHRLQIELASPARPPLALERGLGLAASAGTLARLDGSGAWLAEAGGAFGWRGRLVQLWAGAWDGDTADGAAARSRPAAEEAGYWLDAREVQGEVRFDAQGRLQAIDTDAGSARLAGGVPLRWQQIRWRAAASPQAGDEFSLRLAAGPAAVAPFLQRAQPELGWGGDLRVAAQAEIRAGTTFEAEVTLERSEGDLHITDSGATLPLGLSALTLALSAKDGLWRLTPLLVGRQVGTVTGSLSARAPPQARWPGQAAPIEGALHAAVPQLAVWGGWLPPGWRLDGELSATASVDGSIGAPGYTGELSADGVALRNLLQGVDWRDGKLRMALAGETARITEFTLRGGEGTLVAQGSASFGAEPSARLQAEADKFRVIGRADRRLAGSGRATLTLARERLALEGKLTIDSGLFDLGARDAPSLDDDVVVLRRDAGPAAATAPGAVSPLLRSARVALEVDLGQALRLRGRGLDTTLRGQLKLSTPGGRLAVDGQVQAHDGSYAAYGQKLQIERGVVSFRGPPESPTLDIVALRPNLDMRVGVAITGSALNPRVRLFSEPELSETEKLSWLVLGRGSDGLGRTDTALLQRAALALLAGEGEGPTDALLRAIGIDDLSLRQTDGDTRETIISLGKQLSRRWYVGYERSVNATAGTWQLVYRAALRFTLRAQSGLDNSLDLIWTWRFN